MSCVWWEMAPIRNSEWHVRDLLSRKSMLMLMLISDSTLCIEAQPWVFQYNKRSVKYEYKFNCFFPAYKWERDALLCLYKRATFSVWLHQFRKISHWMAFVTQPINYMVGQREQHISWLSFRCYVNWWLWNGFSEFYMHIDVYVLYDSGKTFVIWWFWFIDWMEQHGSGSSYFVTSTRMNV